jgi:hypothetical protein
MEYVAFRLKTLVASPDNYGIIPLKGIFDFCVVTRDLSTKIGGKSRGLGITMSPQGQVNSLLSRTEFPFTKC